MNFLRKLYRFISACLKKCRDKIKALFAPSRPKVESRSEEMSDKEIVSRLSPRFQDLLGPCTRLDEECVSQIDTLSVSEKRTLLCELIEKSDGCFIPAATIGEPFRATRMRARIALPDNAIVRRIHLCGLVRAESNEVLIKAMVE